MNTTLVKSAAMATVLAAALVAATTAAAQDIQLCPAPSPASLTKHRLIVNREIQKFVTNGLNNGYLRVTEMRGEIHDTDRLAGNPHVQFVVHLERGMAYRIGVRGDADAVLALTLKDGKGAIAANSDPDRKPAIHYQPNATGDYIVVIEWAKNPNASGRTQVGAAVLGRPAARLSASTWSALH